VEEQCQSFKRYGVWGDWEHPYLTQSMNGQMVEGFSQFTGVPVLKALEAELEYPEGHIHVVSMLPS